MKSQKRSSSEKAFNKGYQAAMSGRSWSDCPYESGSARQNWLTGWREAREDHWSGYSPFAQIQKLSNL